MLGWRRWRTLFALIALGSLQAEACSLGVEPEDDYFSGTQKKNSCVGHCNSDQPVPGSSPECWCDITCFESDDCCADWGPVCADGGIFADAGPGSCKGHCGSPDPVPGIPDCYCDQTCTDNGDCCPDFSSVCSSDAAAGG